MDPVAVTDDQPASEGVRRHDPVSIHLVNQEKAASASKNLTVRVYGRRALVPVPKKDIERQPQASDWLTVMRSLMALGQTASYDCPFAWRITHRDLRVPAMDCFENVPNPCLSNAFIAA